MTTPVMGGPSGPAGYEPEAAASIPPSSAPTSAVGPSRIPAAGGRPAIGVPSSWPAPGAGFHQHVADAIALNEAREPIYAQMSGGASTDVSSRLILTEKIDELAAGYFDGAAKKFNAQGIPIVTGDFVPMSTVPPPGTPLRYTGRTPPADLARLELDVLRFHGKLLLDAALGNFGDIGAAAYSLTQEIDALEAKTKSNLAMTTHIVDAIGFAALHAQTYSQMSGGATDALAKQLIATESVALVNAVDTDRRAQPVQAKGVGILVNDLPHIPFQEEWRAAHPQA